MFKQSLFITFEGPEGSGKSSCAKNLGGWILENYGVVPVLLREPGGTEVGEEIRKILLGKDINLSPLAESFLFQASRAQLVEKVIKPSLFQRMIVILDRFIDSSISYQGAGRGLGVEKIKILNDISTSGIIPDITFLLDLDPRIGLMRKREEGKLDRIDSEDYGFHDRVRYSYLRESGKDQTGRWVVIDASLSQEEVNTMVREIARSKMEERGYLERIKIGVER